MGWGLNPPPVTDHDFISIEMVYSATLWTVMDVIALKIARATISQVSANSLMIVE